MTAPMLSFTVFGNPKAKQRPRHSKGGHSYTPEGTRTAERTVAQAFKVAYPLHEPTIEDLRLEVTFYRETRRVVDLDNLVKLLTDSLNKIAYVDDRQIKKMTAEKVAPCGDEARTEVALYLHGADA